MIDERVLGKPRKHPDRCSKCDAEIADEAGPLMLFADGRDLMWCYCETCEQGMFALLEMHKPQRSGSNVGPTD